MGADFSGWATKAGVKCSDGRTIMPNAFKHMDGLQVPLVWQHGHGSAENVLGHVKLENREEGVYAYGFFNNSPAGRGAKELVEHKDVNSLSIYANKLVERSKSVYHGMIREVSLVLAGANPEALIENVQLAHGDGEFTELEDEVIVQFGLELTHGDGAKKTVQHDDSEDGETIGDVYNSMSEKQKNVLSFMLGKALEAKNSAEHSDGNGEGDLNHKEGNDDVTNVFEQGGNTTVQKHVLSHDAIMGIVEDAKKPGATLKSAVQDYAVKHGIESIETLFPDAKTLNNTPEWNKRRTEWVAGVLNGTRHSPFSRVKSVVADLTQDEARAKGYIKGNYKKEEWFGVTKRTTTPTTVYKKQQLDRDDIVDITDFDVVAWLKGEMRMMLEEELARAILIGDGRDIGDDDKIKDPMAATDGAGIRSIVNEHELYATTVNIDVSGADGYYSIVPAVLRARRFYKGTGLPTWYTTETVLSEMLLLQDGMGRDRFTSAQDLATKLRVDKIVTVEPMEDETDLIGIMVNLADYNVGADKGGEVNLFDDFDIDYNQYKYLIETRISGALVKIKSAMVLKKVASGDTLVTPTKPSFVKTTGVVTIPTVTGVTYTNADTDATLTAGAQTALTAGESLNVKAVADAGYYFATNAADEWTFTRPAA